VPSLRRLLFSHHLPWAQRADILLVCLAVLGLFLTGVAEVTRRLEAKPDLTKKMAAATRTVRCFEAIRQHRLGADVPVDRENDPEESGLIGQEFTLITTDRGVLEAKITTINPNFAALFIEYFEELDLKPGDVVAFGMTGSFPALNIAALVAAEEFGLRPLAIASVGASMWGANDPAFTWLDMESLLRERGLLHTRSLAASLGGSNDRGRGLSPLGRKLLADAVARNGVPLISEPTLEDAVARRIALVDSAASPRRVRAYVNIGGSSASIGNQLNGALIRPGINRQLRSYNWTQRGALHHYARRGVPVVHVLGVEEIALAHGFPIAPEATPAVGEGRIFHEEVYDLRIVVPAFLTFLVFCFGVLYTRHHAAAQAMWQSARELEAGPVGGGGGGGAPAAGGASAAGGAGALSRTSGARVTALLLLAALAVAAPGAEAASSRIKAASAAGKMTVTVDGKKSSYDIATAQKPVEVKLAGPTAIRIVTRYVYPAAPKSKKITYKLRVDVDGIALRTLTAQAVVSKSATAPGGKPLGSLERHVVQIPPGARSVRIVPVGGSAPVLVRVLRGEGKPKVKWTAVAPETFLKAVRLHGRDSETTYYRFAADRPAALTITGPTTLRVITRLDFGAERGYSQTYAIKVALDGKPLRTYSFKAKASATLTYPELPAVTPGEGRDLSFEVPKGKHTVTIGLDASTTKTASLRVLMPRAALKNHS